MAIVGFTRAGPGNSRAPGPILRAFSSLVSAHQHYHDYAAGQQVRGGGEPVRGIAGREQEQMRCIWHVCALTAVRRDGKASQPGAGRPGFLKTDRRSFTLCPFPLHLPLPPAALCHRWTGAAERLLALHLHQRARLRHITIWTYYREASIPALPRHWLRLLPLHRRLSRLGKAAISSRPTFSKTCTLHTRPPVLS